MTTKLALYNAALGHLKAGALASLAENREPRRALDAVYDDGVAFCLQRGFWNFAMRVALLDASTSIVPAFGYAYAFSKPADWVRTFLLGADEMLSTPLLHYNDEAGLWYADVTPLTVKYVSSSTSYGMDLAAWPPAFAKYVALYLAAEAGPRIANVAADTIEQLLGRLKQAQGVAMAIDAMDEPPQAPPRGSWASSRGGRRTPRSYPGGMTF